MRKPDYKYFCRACNDHDAELNLDHPFDDVCLACNGVCEKTALCEDCGTEPSYDGVSYCLSCAADACIADPSLIDEYTPAMQADLARELAERLRPRLSVLQAPRPVAA